MQLWVGTSGYSYKEWKGSFYPERLPAREMLSFYGQKLPAVEINNTFYRMPNESVLTSWAEQVPDNFRFAIKASRRITHLKRLQNVEDETAYVFETAGALHERLGVVFFQLPPNLKADPDRLDNFLKLVPPGAHVAFEFRHPSWLEEPILEKLRQHQCALCLSDTDEEPVTELVSTADWGYLRLRRVTYRDEELSAWVERLKAEPWKEAFVFFKHEDAGVGPQLATRLLEMTRR